MKSLLFEEADAREKARLDREELERADYDCPA